MGGVKTWKNPEIANHHKYVNGHSNALVRRYEMQSYARKLFTHEAVASCHVRRIAPVVQVHQPLDYPRPFYSGLKVCQSVWLCPICAAKITTRRRGEVEQAVGRWEAHGGMVVMATFTLRHTIRDPLSDLADTLKGAFRKVLLGRRWGLFLQRYGVKGYIRAMEVTWGTGTGWHPHLHVLFFVQAMDGAGVLGFEQWLQARWNHEVGRLGGWAHIRHGCQVTTSGSGGGSLAADYISKMGGAWRLSDELTRGHTKRGRDGQARMQVVDLLVAYGRYDDHQAGVLWQEYGRYFKGKKQLIWSNGLKKYFEIEEKSDEEVAGEEEERAVLLAMLSAEQWRYVLGNDARADVLLAAERGYEALADFMQRMGAPFT